MKKLLVVLLVVIAAGIAAAPALVGVQALEWERSSVGEQAPRSVAHWARAAAR